MFKQSLSAVWKGIIRLFTNKKALKIYMLTMVVLSGASSPVAGQDARFSQFFATPHMVNPALTSLFSGDYQVMINYRNQWSSFMDNPYRTISAAGDMKIYSGIDACDFIGVGINVLADQAGALNFGTIQGNITGAYYKALNSYGTQYLGIGLSAGIAQRRVTLNPLTDFLDGGEAAGQESFGFYDLSTGLIWSFKPNKKMNMFFGASMFHINKPEQSHFSESRSLVGQDAPLHSRYVIHGGGNFDLGEKFRIKPSFMMQKQGPSYSFDFGSFIQFMTGSLLEAGENAIYLGAWYNVGESVVVAARMDYQYYYLTVSYDFNVDELVAVSRSLGGLEVSLAKAIFRKNRPSCPDPVSCPVF